MDFAIEHPAADLSFEQYRLRHAVEAKEMSRQFGDNLRAAPEPGAIKGIA